MKTDKLFIIILLIGTILSVGITCYKTIVRGDFEVVNTESIEESTDDI